MNPDRSKATLKGVAAPRTKATIKRLQMYRNFKAKRSRDGKIITPAPFQGWVRLTRLLALTMNGIKANVTSSF